jgi:hypothetical protein
MITVKVKAIGHGTGFNQYAIEFEFTSNLDDLTEDDRDELKSRARRIAKDKTACDHVSINEIKFIKEF